MVRVDINPMFFRLRLTILSCECVRKTGIPKGKGGEEMKKHILFCVVALISCLALPVLAAEKVTVEVTLEPSLEMESVSIFLYESAVVQQEGKYGLIHPQGEWVLPCVYEAIAHAPDGQVIIQTNGRQGLYDREMKEILPSFYEQVSFLVDGTIRVKQNGLWGYIDEKGNEIIPIKYEELAALRQSRDNDLLKAKLGDKYGYINIQGDEVIAFNFDQAQDFQQGRAWVSKEGRWACIDQQGEVISDYQEYSMAPLPFYFGLSVVTPLENNPRTRSAFMNREGEIVLDAVYGGGAVFDGFITTEYEGKMGAIDFEGHVRLPFQYDSITLYASPTAENPEQMLCAFVTVDGLIGAVDERGRTLLPEEFDHITNIAPKLWKATKGEQLYLVDVSIPTNPQTTLLEYEGANTEKGKEITYGQDKLDVCGLGLVTKDGKFGYMDKSGALMVPLEYDDARMFFGNYAWVNKGGRWGVLKAADADVAPIAVKPLEGEEKTHRIILTIGSMEAIVDGQAAEEMSTAPAIIQGRAVLPLQCLITDLLRGTLHHSENGDVVAIVGEDRLHFKIGENTVHYQDQEYGLDLAPFEQDSVIYVPVKILQPIAEDITWDETLQAVVITY